MNSYSSLRYPTHWVVFSDKYPLNLNRVTEQVSQEQVTEPVSQEPVSQEPVTQESVSQEPVSQEPVSQEQVTESVSQEPVSQEPVNPNYTVEYYTERPDEFCVSKFTQEYNGGFYYLSRLQLTHGQLSCSNQIENGIVGHLPSPLNNKKKLTLVFTYNNYRQLTTTSTNKKHQQNTNALHNIEYIYDVMQPRNRPNPEEKTGKHKKHHNVSVEDTTY
jgi:hypothetical protein